jgi:protein CpxP
MNILRKSILVGMMVAGIGSVAVAAPAENPHRHRPYADTKFDPAKRAERFDARQQALHDALKLTTQQEAGWKTYLAAIAPKAPAARPERASLKDLPAPQRLEQRLQFNKARLAQQEARLGALKTFYATLSPEQQKTFDGQLAGGRHHGRQHRHG